MKFLFCGDVMGRAGRQAIFNHIPSLRQKHKLDAVIINGENAASGFGITLKIAQQFFDVGVDVITTGNHVWDQKELLEKIHDFPRIIRPVNYPNGTPGKGYYILSVGQEKLMVINVMGQLFMQGLENPVPCIEAVLQHKPLNASVLLDIHAEATSEKQIIAHYFAGRISAAVGTHTHVPTADERVLAGGTCYITDVGMCGDYDSIIGMKKENAIQKYISKLPSEKFSPALNNSVLCGVIIQTDPQTGKGLSIERVQIGKI